MIFHGFPSFSSDFQGFPSFDQKVTTRFADVYVAIASRQVAGLGRATVQGPHPDLRPTKMGLVDELMKESWEIYGNFKMMVEVEKWWLLPQIHVLELDSGFRTFDYAILEALESRPQSTITAFLRMNFHGAAVAAVAARTSKT